MNKYTQFIKKALEISELILPDIKSKEKRLAMISGEKESTVKNWIFRNKIPSSAKRLHISDNFGLSERSLFDNTHEKSIPIAVYNEELRCYLVPQIEEASLDKLSVAQPPLVISGRIPLKSQILLKDEIASPNMTYCLEVIHLSFPPFITANDIIFINHTASKKNNVFCVYKKEDNVQIVKLQNISGNYIMYNKNGEKVRKGKNTFIAPIVLTLSESY
ncbi:hypothetical protein R3D73_005460 [Serratia marcescens]|nr:hypothetical protein [Serratia marcescens]ELQ9442538.1 hypothetical protein [Serratia marcescens]ELT5563293.1 hypothetical protein [Serratia marcescens]